MGTFKDKTPVRPNEPIAFEPPGRAKAAQGVGATRTARAERSCRTLKPLENANALGGLLLRAGRIDEAIARVNEGIAAAKDVEIPSGWAYLALALARKGSLAEARRRLAPPRRAAGFVGILPGPPGAGPPTERCRVTDLRCPVPE